MSDEPTGRGTGKAVAYEATLASADDAAVAGGTAETAPLESVGRYRIERRLGAGAMGVVYQAHDPQLDRRVAIKVVHPRLARHADAAERLLREARAMAKLRHPNVVSVHDAGTADDRLFVAMELIEGTSLGQLFAQRTAAESRDWERWRALMLDAGRGLAAAHAAGILHRDFKPDNVLVATDGRVCVGDFGLAELRVAGEASPPRPPADVTSSADPALDTTAFPDAVDSDGALRLTTTGAVVGTPAYMAPEQLNGQTLDARADQFSYCVALFEALYGTRPFDAGRKGGDAALEALRDAIVAGRIAPAPPGSKVPTRLRAVVARGLAPRPSDRWGSMRELLDALAPRRSRGREVAIVGVLAVAIAAVGIAISISRREDASPSAATPTAPTAPTATVRLAMSRPGSFDVSSDGTRFGFVEARRATAGSFDDPARQSIAAPTGTTWTSLVIDGADRVLLIANGAEDVLHAWTPSTGALEPLYRALDLGRILGLTADGRWLFGREATGAAELVVADGDALRVVATLEGSVSLDHGTLSPDRRRFATTVQRGTERTIVVVPLDGGAAGSLPIAAHAVGWVDDHQLVYSTDQPEAKIFVADLARPDAAHRQIHVQSPSWITQLLVRDGVVLFQDVGHEFSARAIGVDGRAPSREFGSAARQAPLAWLDPDSIVAWDPHTNALVRLTLDGDVQPFRVAVDSKPFRAERADDLLIVTTRATQEGACTWTGFSIATGEPTWRSDRPCRDTVRCGGDNRGRCLTLAPTQVGYVVRWLDLATGVDGDEITRGSIAITGWSVDAAVSADGKTVAIVDSSSQIRTIDAATGTERTASLADNRIGQTVAVEASGSALATAMDSGNAGDYELYRIAGDTATLIGSSENRWMFQPRLSPDGSTLLIRERVFKTELWSLPLSAEE